MTVRAASVLYSHCLFLAVPYRLCSFPLYMSFLFVASFFLFIIFFFSFLSPFHPARFFHFFSTFDPFFPPPVTSFFMFVFFFLFLFCFSIFPFVFPPFMFIPYLFFCFIYFNFQNSFLEKNSSPPPLLHLCRFQFYFLYFIWQFIISISLIMPIINFLCLP